MDSGKALIAIALTALQGLLLVLGLVYGIAGGLLPFVGFWLASFLFGTVGLCFWMEWYKEEYGDLTPKGKNAFYSILLGHVVIVGILIIVAKSLVS
jgi:membrane protein implicated in regulation of membrane protease activity